MLILRGHRDAVRCLSYSPGGRWLATGSEDGTVRLWNLSAGGAVSAVFENRSSVESLAVVSDTTTLIAGTADGEVFVWPMPPLPEPMLSGQGSHAGQAAAVESSRTPLNRVQAHDQVRRLALAPNGATLYTAGWDKTVRVWNTTLWKKPAVLQSRLTPTALAVAPDGSSVAVANENGTVRMYECGTDEHWTDLDSGVPLFALAWSPDSRWLATGHHYGDILLWELPAARPRDTLRGHAWTIYSLVFTPDGRTLISGGADGTVRLWDIATGRERRCFRWHTRWVTCVAVAPDGMTAAAGSADHTVVVWDLDGD